MARTSWQPWWRWPVYAAAVSVVLAACYWCVLIAGVGTFMGFDRSSFQTALFILAIMIVPFLLASGLALGAIAAAKDRHRNLAIVRVILSLLPLPLAWLVMNSRLI